MAMAAALADTTLAVLDAGNTPHVQLHTDDPGAAGTGNVALDPGDDPAVRKAASFAATENHPTNEERRRLSNAIASWSGAELKVGQTLTHFSIWSAESAGSVRFIAPLTASKVTGSDGAVFASGAIECALEVFAKP
jgi:hypothetical protein